MDTSSIALVIPAYNEAKTIASVVESTRNLVQFVIVVNDNSSDQTKEFAESSGAIVVSNSKNLGYEGAIEAGFFKAVELGAQTIITFDADGQHKASCLSKMIEASKQYPLVIGIRPTTARLAESLWGKYFKARFGVEDILCGMKAYRSSIFKEYGKFDQEQLVGTELAFSALKSGTQFTQIPIEIDHREEEDTPRYGGVIKANMKMLKAFCRLLKLDIMPKP